MANAGHFQPGNTKYLGRLGYGVGVPSFLASEESKVQAYWREIEEGTDRFVGTVLAGLFGDVAGRPGEARITGALTPFGEGSGQQFVPFVKPLSLTDLGVTRALKYLRATKAIARGGAPVKGLIQNPIVAQHAYAEAFKSFGAAEKEKLAVEQVLGQMGIFSGRAGGTFRSLPSLRTKRPAALTRSQVISRGGFLTGGATSGYSQSLLSIDRTFARELTELNRVLADGLAAEVARIQEEKIKRKGVSSGRLIAATLNPLNRYPR